MSGQPDGSEYAWVAFAIGSLFLATWSLVRGCM